MKPAQWFLPAIAVALLLCLAVFTGKTNGQGFSGYGVEATRPKSVLQRNSGERIALKSRSPGRAVTFPYKTFAVASGATVYSGPSATFYPTSTVRPGVAVEVYRHDPDGWLAIRPPKDDFSLVRSDDLIGTAKPGVFRVVREGAKAWIGTRINQKHRPVSQVKLDRDELVTVVSTVSASNGEKETAWYQVQPPRGEFRWVHQSQFNQNSGIVLTPKTQPVSPLPGTVPRSKSGEAGLNQSTSDRGPAGSSDISPLHMGSVNSRQQETPWENNSRVQTETQQATPEMPEVDQSWQASKQRTPEVIADHRPESEINKVSSHQARPAGFDRPIDTDFPVDKPNSPAHEVQRQMSSAANDWEHAVRRLRSSKGGFYQAETSQDEGVSRHAIDSTRPVTRTSNQDGFIRGNGSGRPNDQAGIHYKDLLDSRKSWQKQLLDLDTYTSQQVVKPTGQWQLGSIVDAARFLASSARTDSQRRQAHLLEQRLQQFQYLKMRSAETNPNSSVAGNLSQKRFASAGSVTGLLSNPGGVDSQKNHRYDAVGFVKQMILDRGNMQSTFVLQDEHGRTICHVMKMPGGVDLKTYLNKKVGVIGDKGYHQRLRLPNVVVRRIVPLGS